MPNWCNNTVEIYHEDPAMLERVRTAFKDGRLLDEFIPVPDALRIVAGSVGDANDPEQKKLVEQTEANLEKYGYGNWYDFCVNEWGTKMGHWWGRPRPCTGHPRWFDADI